MGSGARYVGSHARPGLRADEARQPRTATVYRPGAPGSILQLGGVATALPAPMPVYAIKPRGLEDGETPYDTVAEMAAHAVEAMRRIRPNGPYYLAGYSAGGLVALEMAQQLSAAGLEVPLVVLLDTYPGWRFWPLRYHADAVLRRAIIAASLLRSGSLLRAIRELGSAVLGFAQQIGVSGRQARPPLEAEGWSVASRKVHLATFAACEAYRPRHYSGRVAFIQPAELENAAPRKPPDLWRTYLSRVEGHVVPHRTSAWSKRRQTPQRPRSANAWPRPSVCSNPPLPTPDHHRATCLLPNCR